MFLKNIKIEKRTYFYSLRGLAVAVRPLLFGLSEAYYAFMAHTKAWRLSSSSFYFSAGINHILVSLDFGTTLDGSNILK